MSDKGVEELYDDYKNGSHDTISEPIVEKEESVDSNVPVRKSSNKPVKDIYGDYKVGNPLKLKTDVKKRLIKSLKNGNPPAVACQAAGIHIKTFKEWMHRGEEGIEPYVTFYLEVEELKAQAIEKHIDCLNEAAESGNIGASQWLLSKVYPEVFGKQENKTKVEKETKQEIVIKSFSDVKKDKELSKKTEYEVEAREIKQE
ncbi:hypothetical protein [Methanobrevibacter sp. DSM 116169]|uniref:hypothetical protein n=1 Tax=Methanobrevibacter sp. DSM 116169 TaxID=3242727 RepID=UPI0038FC8880